MNARTAKGWRWAKGTMKVLGVVLVGWVVASYRTTPPAKLALGVIGLLLFAALIVGLAFVLGWATGK